jgi:hypothetical protein
MNTKLLKATLGVAILMLFVSACGFIPTFGSRTLISENREVNGFTRVDVSGGGSLEIIQDGTEALSVKTDDNMMQYVTSEVRGGTLYLSLDSTTRALIPSSLHFTLHVKDLGGINTSGSWTVTSAAIKTVTMDIVISGSGDVRVDALAVDKLTANISGSGTLNLSGKALSQSIDISGSGKVLEGDLNTQDTTVRISGSGNVTVWVTGTLEAHVSGSGDISYYGSPTVNFDKSGSGSMHSLGTKERIA